MINDLSAQESISWQWDEDVAANTLKMEDGSRFVFTRISGSEMVELQRLRSTGTSIWIRHIVGLRANASVFIHHAGKLYAALYSDTATGCRVLALDADSGNVLWEVPLKGLGFLHHSKYSNRVQMRFIDDQLVIFGNESAGKYIEVLAPSNGRMLSHQPAR